jgi:hypothetical protein
MDLEFTESKVYEKLDESNFAKPWDTPLASWQTMCAAFVTSCGNLGYATAIVCQLTS